MTFLEKAKNDLKDKEFLGDGLPCKCPCKYGYEKEYSCSGVECEDCWNREMPNTEPKADGIPVIPQSEVDAWHNAHESGKAEGYEQGLNDAWELARKIFTFNKNKMEDVFGFVEKRCVFDNLSPQEAFVKLKAYEEAQIEVGDVVIDLDGKERVVLFVDFKGVAQIYGSHGVTNINKEHLKKTGKHIDIQSILEQIGE
jgi:hypothetical protein